MSKILKIASGVPDGTRVEEKLIEYDLWNRIYTYTYAGGQPADRAFRPPAPGNCGRYRPR
jgi:hypothetical protein